MTFRDRLVFRAAGLFGAVCMRALFATLRVEVRLPAAWRGTVKEGLAGKVYGVFHQHFVVCVPWLRRVGVFHPRDRQGFALVSDHRDGEYLAQILLRVGSRLVRGDSRRRPVAGLLGLVKEMRRGGTPVIAVDGPVGPARVIQPGVLFTARTARAPVVMAVFACENAWTLRSWDRTLVPKPFSRVRVSLLDEFLYDETADMDENLRRLGDAASRAEASISFRPAES